MAICSICGQENQDGDWSCRYCGAALGRAAAAEPTYDERAYDEPVRDKGYYDAPTQYGTAAPTIRPLESKSAWDTRSKLIALAIALAVLALAAGAAWFFFLRPAAGDQFVGAWKGALPLGDTHKSGTLTISRKGSQFRLAFVGDKGAKLGPFAASMTGGKLESDLQYTGSDPHQQVATKAVMVYIASMVNDFKLVFFFRGSSLYVEAAGTPRPGVAAALNEPLALVKAQ